jgi:hypothetical protein
MKWLRRPRPTNVRAPVGWWSFPVHVEPSRNGSPSPYDFVCPFCHAEPRYHCVTANGGIMTNTHKGRTELWCEAQKAWQANRKRVR